MVAPVGHGNQDAPKPGRGWTNLQVTAVVLAAVVAVAAGTAAALFVVATMKDKMSGVSSTHAGRGEPRTWQERAAAIPGIVDYLETEPDLLKAALHVNGNVTYPQSPPVGGKHNPIWQNCMGDVYTAPLANEHAVHSMEHGTVWITYRPDLPADQIEALAKKVRGNSYMMLSPYPGLDKPISLQDWGYQLKVDNASDTRIDDFIRALRQNDSQETGARCDGGITSPGLHDIQKVDPSAAPTG
jgi:hypothetical protein